MERVWAWIKEHKGPVAIAAAGVVGLYLVLRSRAAGAGGGPAGSPASLPDTGAAALGDMTPQESLAYQQAQQLLTSQQAAANLIPGEAPSAIHGTQSNGQPWSLGSLQQQLVAYYERATGGQLPPSLNPAAALPPSPEQLATDYANATGQQAPGWHLYAGQGEGTAPKNTLGNWWEGDLAIPSPKQLIADYAASQGVPISANDPALSVSVPTTPAPSSGPLNGPFLPIPSANAAPYSGTATTASVKPAPPLSH